MVDIESAVALSWLLDILMSTQPERPEWEACRERTPQEGQALNEREPIPYTLTKWPEPERDYDDEDDYPRQDEWPDEFTFADAVGLTFNDAKELLLERHAKYGPRNIADAPGGPLNGLRVRMTDKLARINNYVDGGGVADFADDSLQDAFIDIANYGLIGLMVLRGYWPAGGSR
ncbi:nucleotide modification associated domain-containing protein [Longispora fulva]|uniref:Nucleotide modification associated domain-containing protein n=1 Tax=Longispora fulva TaxID=619741 RepID=A0A8J7GJ53_9ACTN|nr:nucleotide modification associated domain-containing protein [Longispora fulva]MBG6140244.1 hypothetical protein [Longispora fulva]